MAWEREREREREWFEGWKISVVFECHLEIGTLEEEGEKEPQVIQVKVWHEKLALNSIDAKELLEFYCHPL